MDPAILSIIIICAIAVLFATEIFPLGVTALIGAVAMALSGITTFADIYAGFASDTVWMLLGVMIIGGSMFETGLAPLLGKQLMRTKHLSERGFLMIIIISSAAVSAFMSNTAVTAMYMPIIATVAANSAGRITKKNTFMALSIATTAGGMLTLVGTTPQLIAQSFLVENGYTPLGMFTQLPAALPGMIIVVVYFATFGYSLQKKVFKFEEQHDAAELEAEKDDRPKSRIKMAISGTIMAFAIVGFVTGLWTTGTVAMVGALLCIITRCMTFKRAMETVEWNTIFVVGGCLGFAKGLDISGGGKLIAESMIQLFGGEEASPFVIMCVIIIVASVLTQLMSNTALVTMLCPIVMVLATEMGVNPLPFLLAVINGANIAYATPIGTTTSSMVLSAGYRFNDYIKVGGPLTILCLISQIIVIPLVYPFY